MYLLHNIHYATNSFNIANKQFGELVIGRHKCYMSLHCPIDTSQQELLHLCLGQSHHTILFGRSILHAEL